MIYLDNSATTALDPQVYEAMIPYLTNEYGNPASKYYPLALYAQQAVEKAREQVARLIGAKPEEVVFTSGATESNNMILKGVSDYRKYYERKGNHIITSQVEHHAVLNTCKFLNGELYSNRDATFALGGDRHKVDRGFEVTFLPVNQNGQVEPSEFERAIEPSTTIASVIWGNNETGTINPLNELGSIAKRHGVFFHSDATQVLGKIPIDAPALMVDALSFSAHKLNGPKGTGALYMRADEYGIPPFTSFMHGGSQENGIRGGTLNVAGIVGFGAAAKKAGEYMADGMSKQRSIDQQVFRLLKQTPWLELVGDEEHRLPGVFSIIVNRPSFHNELFLKHVSSELALSSGSACTSGEPSHVLQAIGRGHQTGKVLRISLGRDADIQDVDRVLELIFRF